MLEATLRLRTALHDGEAVFVSPCINIWCPGVYLFTGLHSKQLSARLTSLKQAGGFFIISNMAYLTVACLMLLSYSLQLAVPAGVPRDLSYPGSLKYGSLTNIKLCMDTNTYKTNVLLLLTVCVCIPKLMHMGMQTKIIRVGNWDTESTKMSVVDRFNISIQTCVNPTESVVEKHTPWIWSQYTTNAVEHIKRKHF